jgi:hypothetical protein
VRYAACAIAWPESGAVIRTNRNTSAALAMISALAVPTAASRTSSVAGPVTSPAAWS